ncbi:MAG TPA: thiamine phosphate synthase [Thermoanaerobaculia bacterium]|nr:thiamine phosphate synthase [Thermoanaerobaculia bacterium]
MKSYAIANAGQEVSPRFVERIALLSELGVDYIQLRAKSAPPRFVFEMALTCRRTIDRATTKFVVNGRADVAIAAGADGVHLPADELPEDAVRRAGPSLIIGRSCHTLVECQAASRAGADYVLFGSVFAPRSKEGEARVDRDLLARAATGSELEVFAIGGIARDNLEFFRGLPIAGLAGITLFMEDEPLSEIVREIAAL